MVLPANLMMGDDIVCFRRPQAIRRRFDASSTPVRAARWWSNRRELLPKMRFDWLRAIAEVGDTFRRYVVIVKSMLII